MTETEVNTTDEAEKLHPQGTTAPPSNEASGHFYTSVEEVPCTKTHSTTLETSSLIEPTAKQSENPDDVNETDIKEIDDENQTFGDGDISLLDQKQPSHQVKSVPDNGGNIVHIEDTVEFVQANEDNVKVKQSLRDDHISHENSSLTGLSEKDNNPAKSIEIYLENPPQSETDQAKQFAILIGRHKNATVRVFSAKTAPNSDAEQTTAQSAPKN